MADRFDVASEENEPVHTSENGANCVQFVLRYASSADVSGWGNVIFQYSSSQQQSL